jgi:hypothetical protein
MDEWLIRYWNWFGSIDWNFHPRNDKIGEYCGTNQNGPVWFLDFLIEGPKPLNITKDCTIPEGKAIFIPSHVGECDRSERMDNITGRLSPYSDEEITKCAIEGNNGGHIELRIDGVDFYNGRHETKDPNAFPEELRYRTTTDFFNLTLGVNNDFHVRPGTYKAKADGYFAIVQPLPIGNHTIFLHSDQTQGEEEEKYVLDHIWNIEIKQNSTSFN